MRVNKKGFIFIETIVVVCVLTVSLMSLYANYSKIISNTKELNTFDTAEYNYKTYFLKTKFENSKLVYTSADGNNYYFYPENRYRNQCFNVASNFSDSGIAKVCLLGNVHNTTSYLNTNKSKFDAYIIDYLNTKDFTNENNDIFLVEYKKEDKINPGEYLTYISSLNY